MNKSYFLGVDTSNYTTSLAVVDEKGSLVAENRRALQVAQGKKGLRQSEALFLHIQNLPKILGDITRSLPGWKKNLRAIAVSTKPRPLEGSYMPVFIPGKSLGLSLASLLEIPYYSLSHQENHLWAGLHSAKGPKSNRFLALHLSGGTSECLDVSLTEKEFRFNVEVIGGSNDINAGQFIDRVGVALGLPFPAGPHLEQLALESSVDLKIPTYHKNGNMSFSGPETAALRLISTKSPCHIARAVLLNISRAVTQLIVWAFQKTNVHEILLVGGVSSNSLIRKRLIEELPNLNLYFAAPSYCVDNALGAALYCGLRYLGKDYFGNVLT